MVTKGVGRKRKTSSEGDCGSEKSGTGGLDGCVTGEGTASWKQRLRLPDPLLKLKHDFLDGSSKIWRAKKAAHGEGCLRSAAVLLELARLAPTDRGRPVPPRFADFQLFVPQQPENNDTMYVRKDGRLHVLCTRRGRCSLLFLSTMVSTSKCFCDRVSAPTTPHYLCVFGSCWQYFTCCLCPFGSWQRRAPLGALVALEDLH